MTPIAEKNRRVFDAAEYDAMVAGVRDVMETHVPPSATVAIVSRGDDSLVALGGRFGAHFPQAADGAYAGHHPPDSESAIAHLEELRASGVAFLGIPSSSLWWLDHYVAFAEHLDAHYELVADEDSCRLYALGSVQIPTPAAISPAEEPQTHEHDPVRVGRAQRFLDALLPSPCRVLMVGAGWRGLSLADRSVECIEDPTGAELALAGAGRTVSESAYAVLPLDDDAPAWVDAVRAGLEARRPPLARRHPLACVFDLQARDPK